MLECQHAERKTPSREAESIALEGRIRSVKDLKAETLEQILEAERQVMLWEKKTQLERETQVRIPTNISHLQRTPLRRHVLNLTENILRAIPAAKRLQQSPTIIPKGNIL